MLLPGKGVMAKKAPNPQTLSSKIDIALRLRVLRNFPSAPLRAFFSPISPSNYRKAVDVVYNGG